MEFVLGPVRNRGIRSEGHRRESSVAKRSCSKGTTSIVRKFFRLIMESKNVEPSDKSVKNDDEIFLKPRGAYLYRRERKNRNHKLADRLPGVGIESRRRARSGGSRATSGTTGSSEDGSSGQHDDYDTEVFIIFNLILDD